MSDELIAVFTTAAGDLERTIAGIAPEQFSLATPCDGWDARALINHVVGGNHHFVALATGAPAPDRDKDFLGDDPLAAYRTSIATLTEAFSEDGFVSKPVSTPLGDGVGAILVTMRVVESITHAWDLAVATGQPREFDPTAVNVADQAVRNQPIPRGAGMFGEETKVPENASAVDALAAYLGRSVPQPA